VSVRFVASPRTDWHSDSSALLHRAKAHCVVATQNRQTCAAAFPASLGHMTALAPTAPNFVDPCRSRALPRIQYFQAFRTCHLHSSGGLLFKPVTKRRSVSNLRAGDQSGRTAQAAETMQRCFKRMFEFKCSDFTGSHVGFCKLTTSSHQRQEVQHLH